MSFPPKLFILPFELNFFFGNIAFITLFIAVFLYWFDFFDSRWPSKKLKNICMITANVSLSFILIQRWYESGHFPLSNLYESLIGLSWGFTSVHLILVMNPLKSQSLNNKLTSDRANGESKKREQFSIFLPKANDQIGAITAPTALLTSVFATFFLPPELTRASALIPALKSNWLTMHVTVMVASYAFLLIGSLLSITYCVYGWFLPFFYSSEISKEQEYISNRNILTEPSFANLKNTHQVSFFNPKNPINYSANEKTLAFSGSETDNFELNTKINHLNFQEWLSTTSYRILGLGFPLLTIGILSGAVWANEAWGSYWSWDPKETWALITWLVFAVYFHSRYTRSSDSFIPAIIASVGFIVIWICYLGVNLLGTGLHSYGWFSS